MTTQPLSFWRSLPLLLVVISANLASHAFGQGNDNGTDSGEGPMCCSTLTHIVGALGQLQSTCSTGVILERENLSNSQATSTSIQDLGVKAARIRDIGTTIQDLLLRKDSADAAYTQSLPIPDIFAIRAHKFELLGTVLTVWAIMIALASLIAQAKREESIEHLRIPFILVCAVVVVFLFSFTVTSLYPEPAVFVSIMNIQTLFLLLALTYLIVQTFRVAIAE